MAGETGATTSPLLNRLQYEMANRTDDIGTAATGDRVIVADASADYEIKYADAGNMLELTGITASVTEVNRATDVSGRLVAGGATLSMTEALHDGKTVLWDTAAGTILTLPASSGSGARFRCCVSVLATSNAHSIACVGTDMMQGAVGIVDTDTGDATIQYAALVGDTFDTITMNRTTTGLAAPGDWVELEDVVSGVWAVKGVIRASGTVATPFSSAV
ncbi:MAG: hypothetical protein GY943_30570 [Chloroflexi bacterium]|nr:hypothetical protein [Chloroflexota bacterium]